MSTLGLWGFLSLELGVLWVGVQRVVGLGSGISRTESFRGLGSKA